MTQQDQRAPVAIHVVWHPAFLQGRKIADEVFAMFRNDVTQGQGGFGIPVYFYSEPRDRSQEDPCPLRLDAAGRHCVLLLVDEDLIDAVGDGTPWRAYVEGIRDREARERDHFKLIPVTLSDEAIDFCNREGLPNAIRWHYWDAQDERRKYDNLALHLIPQLLDFLRLESGGAVDSEARKKVDLFISHAKLDGRDLALEFRSVIQTIPGLGDFFDEVDINPGEQFEDVLGKAVGRSAILAIQTQAYATRDWCCWEVVAGKRLNVPIVAAHCVKDQEDRTFPYLGNTPSVTVTEASRARLLEVVRRLLEEVLRELLWRCRVKRYREAREDDLKDAVDTWRPPELVWLALNEEVRSMTGGAVTVLYPDPPLGRNELAIIEGFDPRIELLTPTQLMARE